MDNHFKKLINLQRFCKNASQILRLMFKLKILFAAVFIIAISHLFPSGYEAGERMASANKADMHSNFEESNTRIFTFGEVVAGNIGFSVLSTVNQGFFSNFKVNGFSAAFNFISSKRNFLISCSQEFTSLCYRVSIVPIYLQVRNFRL